MCACEDREVHRSADVVVFVKTHAKVPLTTEQQQDEDADVYEAHTRCTTDYA
jgi:hypothetical protein